MLRTRLCDLLGIDVPIICAPMGPSITSPEPAAAVSNAGGLGIISVALRPHLGPEGLTFPQDAHVVLARTWLSIPSVWRAVGR